MTIQEVIKTGKAFRRGKYFSMDYRTINFWYAAWINTSVETFSEDLLATDWEVEVIKKELSAQDIIDACEELNSNSKYPGAIGYISLDSLLKILGLE